VRLPAELRAIRGARHRNEATAKLHGKSHGSCAMQGCTSHPPLDGLQGDIALPRARRPYTAVAPAQYMHVLFKYDGCAAYSSPSKGIGSLIAVESTC